MHELASKSRQIHKQGFGWVYKRVFQAIYRDHMIWKNLENLHKESTHWFGVEIDKNQKTWRVKEKQIADSLGECVN